MSESATFGVLDAVLGLADTVLAAQGVTVSDSSPEEFSEGTHAVIGADDWDAGSSKDSANSVQEWGTSTSDRMIDEAGSIAVMAWAQSAGWGREDVRTARESVRLVMDTLGAALRQAVEESQGASVLGVEGLWDIHLGGVDRFKQFPTDEGSRAVLRFAVNFQATI